MVGTTRNPWARAWITEALFADGAALLKALGGEAQADRGFRRNPTGESTLRLIEARKRVDELAGAYLRDFPAPKSRGTS